MSDTEDDKRVSPEPPLSPDFPDLRHPDLDKGSIGDVETPPNSEEIKPDDGVPEPPD